MNYILQNLALAVQKDLQPPQLLQPNLSQTESDKVWMHAFTHAHKLKYALLERTALAKTGEELKILIQTLEINCIELCNTVEGYTAALKTLPAAKTVKEITRENYRNLQHTLADLLLFMQQRFPTDFDSAQTVPKAYKEYFYQKRCPRIKNIKLLLQQKCTDEKLLQMLMDIIQRFGGNETNAAVSFAQLKWFTGFVQHAERLIKKSSCDDLTGYITNMLLHLNFNKPAFIEYIIEKLQHKTNTCDTLHEQVKLWSDYLTRLSFLPDKTLLYVDRAAVKTLLAQKIKMCMAKLEAEIKEQPSRVAVVNTSFQLPISTGISVSQLAVMLRLMVDTGMIQYNNQSELIKKIAGTFQTPKASVISADSLRTKYYSPEKAAMEIVKDYLFKMVGLLKEY